MSEPTFNVRVVNHATGELVGWLKARRRDVLADAVVKPYDTGARGTIMEVLGKATFAVRRGPIKWGGDEVSCRVDFVTGEPLHVLRRVEDFTEFSEDAMGEVVNIRPGRRQATREEGRRAAKDDVLREYVVPAISTYADDPADSPFQHGYLQGMQEAHVFLTTGHVPRPLQLGDAVEVHFSFKYYSDWKDTGPLRVIGMRELENGKIDVTVRGPGGDTTDGFRPDDLRRVEE